MIIKRTSNRKLRILVVRCDRLGDVLLSTPVFEVLARHYPHAKITAMVREPMKDLVGGLPSVHNVLVYEPEGKHAGIRGIFRLAQELRRRRFRIAVVLQSQWRVSLAVFLASIRTRVGPLSKLHSYFFFNRGIRQHRSQVEMHETDYNLQLLRMIGIRVGTRNIPVRAHVSEDAKESARLWLETRKWNPAEALVGVHPGMGGSALNWPEASYVELIRALLKEGRQVVVTGGAAEDALLNRIGEQLGPWREKTLFFGGKDAGSIELLGGIYSHCAVIVAPSTGPLHLAVAVGKPVVTFYPPIRVQSAIRWGPYLGDETRSSVLVPEVYCGEDFKCRGNLCNYHPCMKGITVNQALEQVLHQLNQERK